MIQIQRPISGQIFGVLLFLGVLGGELGFSQRQLMYDATPADDRRPTADDNKEEARISRSEITGFTVIGIEARTNNAKESGADGVIPKQWQRFFSEGLAEKIPNKTGPNFYAVYTDYASDHNADYTYVVGAQVKEGTPAPSGMVAKSVPAGRYVFLTTDKGPLAKVMPAAWQHILELEGKGKLKRAYKTDFEIYDQRAQDPQNAQVDIYIGVK